MGHEVVVKLLLAAGACKEAPLLLARLKGHGGVVALLEGAINDDWLDGVGVGKLSISNKKKKKKKKK
jgi:hypothetical protein